ncbi:alpha/beta hydrolase [Candidatus Daviesbacteria bacterium]|nr:alpha/beta hydrolase [Candidatus Daviesbacteria bacterium]
MSKRVIIVHGWSGSPAKDFFPWLREELEKKGYEVMAPTMPNPDYPKIENWVPYLAKIVGEVRADDVLVGHSMGCQTILRFLEGLPENKKVGKVILVAGFGAYLKGLTEEEQQIAQSWIDSTLNLEEVKTKANSFVAVFSDNDPFVPLEINKKLFEEKLGAKVYIEHNKGHFNEMSHECPDLIKLF